MPAIYHEGSWLGNATDPEVLVKDTVGWTGKNLLKNKATTQTVNGITFTVNADGSVTINGTATGIANINFAEAMTSDKELIFSLGANSSSTTFKGFITASDGTGDIANTGNSGSVKFTTSKSFFCHMVVYTGATLSNVIVYPMLRKADITDPTYEPYHESVEEEIEQIYADNGVLGAKNLLENECVTATKNGITATVNSDGTVTVNGTATAEAIFTIHRYLTDIKLSGNFILNGCPTGGTNTTYQIYLQRRNAGNTGWDNPIYRDFGDGVNVTIEDGRLFDVNILIRNGATLNNLVFKPMLRLASDPDDTYQPYAMTNRELTEKKINIADLKTVVSASSDFTDFKTRIASL